MSPRQGLEKWEFAGIVTPTPKHKMWTTALRACLKRNQAWIYVWILPLIWSSGLKTAHSAPAVRPGDFQEEEFLLFFIFLCCVNGDGSLCLPKNIFWHHWWAWKVGAHETRPGDETKSIQGALRWGGLGITACVFKRTFCWGKQHICQVGAPWFHWLTSSCTTTVHWVQKHRMTSPSTVVSAQKFSVLNCNISLERD